jgi:hypothetical protein
MMPGDPEENNNFKSSLRNTGEIIYNITLKVERSIEQPWLQWLVNDYAPAIIATNCFTKFTTLKLLELDDADDSTYAVQFLCESFENYERYLKNFANDFLKRSFDKWGQKTISFSTVMQVVR